MAIALHRATNQPLHAQECTSWVAGHLEVWLRDDVSRLLGLGRDDSGLVEPAASVMQQNKPDPCSIQVILLVPADKPGSDAIRLSSLRARRSRESDGWKGPQNNCQCLLGGSLLGGAETIASYPIYVEHCSGVVLTRRMPETYQQLTGVLLLRWKDESKCRIMISTFGDRGEAKTITTGIMADHADTEAGGDDAEIEFDRRAAGGNDERHEAQVYGLTR
ncbi:hypothetical protein Micbo1qcDRAFT_174076 [Microdochium bolleyi]|uniref:Uncharacterized protein n=1 Tax=Microdochium bolleyi TaxID=196109 RepID=A0A136J702_9PEZI|nr:hypothetical protein Micbo1qcDRAFT_174076 [Microdochium bolleyi]